MKRKLVLIATTIALLVLAVPALAMAQGQGPPLDASPVKDWLAIVAPPVASVGQEISMTVFKASEQSPVEGAGVWALSHEKADALKEELSTIRGADTSAQEEMLGINGTLLGRTGETGRLFHTFDEAGRYLLVAIKPGFWPDVRPLAVGAGTARPALAIDAQRRAEAGEKFDVTVTERGTGYAVNDAGVWALTRERAESVRAEMQALRQNSDAESLEASVENSLSLNGIFLGTTNGAGKVQPPPSLEKAGVYVLATFKRGYFPGIRPIGIGTAPKALAIDAPDRAKVNEKVTVIVIERGTGDAVKDAGVWALTRQQAESLRAEVEGLRQTSDQATIQAQIEDALGTRGIFLGTTNGAGKIQAEFENAGGYLLVTYKPAYWPAFKGVLIVDPAARPENSRPARPSVTQSPAVSGAALGSQ